MRSDSLLFRMRGVIALLILAAFVAAFVLTACGNGTAEPSPVPEDDPADDVTVLSAASAEPALEQLTDDLAGDDTGMAMDVEYGGTPSLISRIEAGHGFDLLLTASREHMAEMVSAHHIEADPLPVASNHLVLAVPQDNPGGIDDFADFAERAEELTTAVCAEDVPCGQLAATLSEELGVELHADSEESSASEVVERLTSGEADAGLIYLTDALAAEDEVNHAEVPDFQQSTTQLWVGVSSAPENPDAAQQLLQHFAGETGRAAFDDAGFLAPPAEADDET